MPHSQHLSQEQRQKLSPQQLLLIRLLQAPVGALEQAVKAEIEKNPLLEDEHIEGEAPMESAPAEEEGPEELDFEEREIDPFADEEDDEDYRYSDHYGQPKEDKERDSRESFVRIEVSFGAYLMEQFSMKRLSDVELIIGNEIIGSIDASGYLGRDTGLIANDLVFKQNIATTPQEVERVLEVVQSLDPAGVGARNLRECLALQLHRQPDANPVALAIVDKHFDDFTQGRLEQLTQKLGVDASTLEQAIAAIRALNPKPGSAYSDGTEGHLLTPDFIVTASPADGTLDLELNDGNLPQLSVSRYYTDMLHTLERKGTPSPQEQETMTFIRQKADSAQWFIDLIGQRHHTLRLIMETILDYQRPYFLSGMPSDLKPMRLQDIAEPTGFDISTVSRVVNQKTVQTFFGTFLLKDLFSYAYTDSEGNSVSTDAIRHCLKGIVEGEDKRNPLTDDEIAQRLEAKGFAVARRTVAKYRDTLGIPIRRLRKKL